MLGKLDTSFGPPYGIALVLLPQPVGPVLATAAQDRANAVGLQRNGKIVAVGTSSGGFNAGGDFVVARYTSTGKLDQGFGTGGGGVARTNFNSIVHPNDVIDGESTDVANALAIQRDGKLVVAGSSNSGSSLNDFALARYRMNGTLDPTFGQGLGVVLTNFAGVPENQSLAQGVALQGDGKVVAAGYFIEPGQLFPRFALARYNTDGTPDLSFGTANGLVATSFQPGKPATAYAVAIRSGRIVVAGGTVVGNQSQFALAAYDATGSLDQVFGTQGRVTTAFPGGANAHALALAPQGKLVAAGTAYIAGQYRVALARYLSDGSLDPTFGPDGRVFGVLENSEGTISGGANAVAILPNKKILVAGWALQPPAMGQAGPTIHVLLACYKENGWPDLGFGPGGFVLTSLGSTEDTFTGLAIQPNGRAIAAGWASVSAMTFLLARYK